MLRSFLGSLTCAVLLAGCKTPEPAAPPAPVEVAPPPAEARASVAGPRVEGPRMRLEERRLLVDDQVVVPNLALALEEETLSEALSGALQVLHPRKPDPTHPGTCMVEVSPEVPFAVAASVLSSSAIEGYPVAWVSTGSRYIKLQGAIPASPDAAWAAEKTAPATRQLALHLGSAQTDLEVFRVMQPADAAEKARLEPLLKRSLQPGSPGASELAAALTEPCRDAPRPCPQGAWLWAEEGLSFGEAWPALEALAAAQGGKPVPGEDAPALLIRFRGRSETIESPPPVLLAVYPPLSRGRLEPEEIQRIVRGNFPAMRRCYEEGLMRDNALKGLVRVRFVIGTDGRVTKAKTSRPPLPLSGGKPAQPWMPDKKVVACVVSAFEGLVFPAPENGAVTVIYPIMFAPGG